MGGIIAKSDVSQATFVWTVMSESVTVVVRWSEINKKHILI